MQPDPNATQYYPASSPSAAQVTRVNGGMCHECQGWGWFFWRSAPTQDMPDGPTYVTPCPRLCAVPAKKAETKKREEEWVASPRRKSLLRPATPSLAYVQPGLDGESEEAPRG